MANEWQTFNSRNPLDKPTNLRTAHIFSTARSLVSLAKLGSATIHSAAIGDLTSATLRLGKDGMGPFGYVRDLVNALKNNQVDAGVFRDHQMIWDSRYFGMTDQARTYGDLRYVNHQLGT